MKIALLADLHLPESNRTVKEEVLDWALKIARREGVERMIGVGDLVGTGSAVAALRLRNKLESTGIPFLLTPGNAELRSPVDRARVLEILHTPVEDEGIVLLDSSRGRLSDEARRLLGNGSCDGALAVSHCPPEEWPTEDRALLAEAFESGRIAKLACGHRRGDVSAERLELVRGLDPDKVQGGAPAVVILDGAGRRDVVYSPADPRDWPEGEREAFLSYLGCSGMARDPLGVLRRAAAAACPVFELRSSTIPLLNYKELCRELDIWRGRGGKVLSLHLPELVWSEGELSGTEELERAVEIALELGCGRVTWHVPCVNVREFGEARGELLTAAAETVRALTAAGLEIGIENRHIRRGETADHRSYGCTPAECREWIELLRWKLDCCCRVGFHFDLGHARNNIPLSTTFALSDWFEELGEEINGYDLHQVGVRADGSLGGHLPMKELFGKLISLSSLFLAWKRGAVNPAPMFLEIREGDPVESLLALREALIPPGADSGVRA